MKNRMIIFSICIMLFCLMSKTGQTCTTFCLDHGEQIVFGRNYDWMVEDGLVIINKRGVKKNSTYQENVSFFVTPLTYACLDKVSSAPPHKIVSFYEPLRVGWRKLNRLRPAR